MIYQVLKATNENPVKNDFVSTCRKYLKILDIQLSFEEIANMSKYSLKKILKEKTTLAAYKYLTGQKESQKKISDIKYTKLEMQPYLADGDRNIRLTKLIFKARGRNLDIKIQKRWKYDDTLCSGCKVKEESGEEIFMCSSLGENPENLTYSWFYRDSVKDQISAAKMLMKKLKIREKIREEVT